jgi:hypothetical protein
MMGKKKKDKTDSFSVEVSKPDGTEHRTLECEVIDDNVECECGHDSDDHDDWTPGKCYLCSCAGLKAKG